MLLLIRSITGELVQQPIMNYIVLIIKIISSDILEAYI